MISRRARNLDAVAAPGELLFRKGSATSARWRSYDHKDTFEPAQAPTAPPTDTDELGSWLKYDGPVPAPADQAKAISGDERPTSWSKYETKPLASLLGSIEKPRSKVRRYLPETVAATPHATVALVANDLGPDAHPDPSTREPTVAIEEPAVAAESPTFAEATFADAPATRAPEPDLETEPVAPEPTIVDEEPAIATETVTSVEAPPLAAETVVEEPRTAVEESAAAATGSWPMLNNASPTLAVVDYGDDLHEPQASEPSDALAPASTEPPTPPAEAPPTLVASSEQESIPTAALSEAPGAESHALPQDDPSISAETREPLDTEVDARGSAPPMAVPAFETVPVEPPRPPVAPAVGVPASGKKAMLARLTAMLEQVLSARRKAPLPAPVDDPARLPPELVEAIASDALIASTPGVQADPPAAETGITTYHVLPPEAPAGEPLAMPPPEEAPAEVVALLEVLRQPDTLEMGADGPIEPEAQPPVDTEITPALTSEPEIEQRAFLAPTLEHQARASDPDVPIEEAAPEQEPTRPDQTTVKAPDPLKKAKLERLAEMLERAIIERPASASSEPPDDLVLTPEVAHPVADEAPPIEPQVPAPDGAPVEVLESTASLWIAEPAGPTVPIAVAQAAGDTTPKEATPEPEASASPPLATPGTEEITPVAIEATVSDPAHAPVEAMEMAVVVATAEPLELAARITAAEESGAAVPIEAPPEPEAIVAWAPSEPDLLETGMVTDSETYGPDASPTADQLGNADAAVLRDAPEGETAAPEAFDKIAAAMPEDPALAAPEARAVLSSDPLEDMGSGSARAEPAAEAATEPTMPAMPPEAPEYEIASQGPIIVSAELTVEPPTATPVRAATTDLEPARSPEAPLPPAAAPSLTPVQQEKAARQTLTNDLAEVIHSVLSNTQFATKALNPKRYAEAPQADPADQPELPDFVQELSASLPHPVAIRSRFGRLERVLAFASIGMMVAVGYFGLSLWRDESGARTHAPAVSSAAPPSDAWGERARAVTRDLGAIAVVTQARKTQGGEPEAGAAKPTPEPHSPALAQ